jgi:hypothetical protein
MSPGNNKQQYFFVRMGGGEEKTVAAVQIFKHGEHKQNLMYYA